MMIKKATVAGRFYPKESSKLKDNVISYLRATEPLKNKVYGLLVPHAGYVYSGAIAGAGFSHIKEMDFDTIVFFAAAHTMHVDGAALMKEGFFETPLGQVEIDSDITQALLKKSKVFEDISEAHASEHSIEVQLPFLQVISNKKIKIVPLVLNTKNLKTLYEAGRAVAEVIKDKKTLICISSDLSHYPTGDTATKTDLAIMKALRMAVKSGDLSYFDLANKLVLSKARYEMDTAACGESAIIAGATACMQLGADDFKLLRYMHSGKISGDDSNVVGYGAGVFIENENKASGASEFSEDDKEHLLHYARQSIAYNLKNKKEMSMPLSDIPEFNVPAAVFVTLTENGSLRGCIGIMEARETLLDSIINFAGAAAFEDHRFAPLTEEELNDIKIEISILSPMVKVESYKDIEEGKHGVLIRKGRSSGTYLPQVWKHFKTRDEFLSSLCAEKAGLPALAWKEKSTDIYVYTVDSFEEK
ncbi:MAG: AmmeMemoRadiSam system protein B [Elusimicrobiota bacterium]|nr:AmmeMemoRadiSam system protein B [Elusimicrobiota bacterium]